MAVLFEILKVLSFRRNRNVHEVMSMTGILEKLKWDSFSLRETRKDNR